MNELSDLSRSGFVKELMFGSAIICVLLGVLMMSWIPVLTFGVLANLWSATYFFIWADTVFALSIQSESYKFLTSFALGLMFIYTFFFVLNYLGKRVEKNNSISGWRTKIVHYWIWGWMSFYLGLSILLIFNSFEYGLFRLTLAMGALFICFLNYLLSLFLQRAENKNVEVFSKRCRIGFIVWFVILVIFFVGQKWMA